MTEHAKRGTVAGLAAGVAVAVFMLVHDLVQLDPLATPRMLAANLLGVPLEADGQLGTLEWIAGAARMTGALAIYTVAHFSVFVLLGLGAAWLFVGREWPANLLTGALFGVAAGTAVFYAGFAILAPDFLAAPDWRLLVIANGLAGVVMVSQLVDHPEPA